MEIRELFEESVQNKFPYDYVTCHWESENVIFEEKRGWRFYLNEDDTKVLREHLSYPAVVHSFHSLSEEINYYLKLKSQEIIIKEFKLGDKTILESQFKKGKKFSNTTPFESFDDEELDEIRKFYRLTESLVKNRHKTRIKFVLRMLEIEKWGVLEKLSSFSEYSHVKF